jgi:hypothetical protein
MRAPYFPSQRSRASNADPDSPIRPAWRDRRLGTAAQDPKPIPSHSLPSPPQPTGPGASQPRFLYTPTRSSIPTHPKQLPKRQRYHPRPIRCTAHGVTLPRAASAIRHEDAAAGAQRRQILHLRPRRTTPENERTDQLRGDEGGGDGIQEPGVKDGRERAPQVPAN